MTTAGRNGTPHRGSADLLLIDLDAELRQRLTRHFTGMGYRVSECEQHADALGMVDHRAFDVILLDTTSSSTTGWELLEAIHQRDAEAEILVLTGDATIESAVQAMKLGASDFLIKPPNMEKLDFVVHKAMESRQLRRENTNLKTALHHHRGAPVILGDSPEIREIFRLIERTAHSDKPILIYGESGTGKELVARALHAASPLADRPFIAVNCAALPETLLESELFGHEKGAFTGAVQTKPGLFEVADGGTLLIDEVGELAGPLQAKLLRVLEDGTLRRVGSIKERRVHVRVLAATNRDLEHEVHEGRFREDLFYRLNVLTIKIPPLRERQGDVRRILQNILGDEWQLAPDVVPVLERYSWPGNVRQLINAIDRAKTLAETNVIELRNLPAEIVGRVVRPLLPSPGSDVDLETLNRLHVAEVFRRHNGNKARTARALGIGRRSLYRLLEKYHIDQPNGAQTEAMV